MGLRGVVRIFLSIFVIFKFKPLGFRGDEYPLYLLYIFIVNLFASANSGVPNIPQWHLPSSGISFSRAGLHGPILLSGFFLSSGVSPKH